MFNRIRLMGAALMAAAGCVLGGDTSTRRFWSMKVEPKGPPRPYSGTMTMPRMRWPGAKGRAGDKLRKKARNGTLGIARLR